MRSRIWAMILLATSTLTSLSCPIERLFAQPQAVRPDGPPAHPPSPKREQDEQQVEDDSRQAAEVAETLVEKVGTPSPEPLPAATGKDRRGDAKRVPSTKLRAQKRASTDAAASQKSEDTKQGERNDQVNAKASAKEKGPSKSVIRLLELSGNYVDLALPLAFDPADLLLGSGSLKEKSFYRLCDHLEDLESELSVSHIVFDLSDAGLTMNPAQLDEITRRIEKLKQSGKHTFAWLENPGNVHLALACACDKIWLADFGGVDMPSLTMQSMFFRDAMDLVGIQASVVRAGNFKGAVEPFLHPQMSEHLRAHYVAMLGAMNDAQVDRIAHGRGKTVASVRDLQKRRLLQPGQALSEGIVDRLAPYGSMRTAIEEEMGESMEWTKPKVAAKREMSMFELMGRMMSGDKKSNNDAKSTSIAVLHLSGTIEDGKQPSLGSIVSGPTVTTIEEIANDDQIKGVIVRINSPGGSATASEAIRRALVDMAGKKPTVISMGETAASGGYWIACIGQPIYAEKGTITGSIGVFSLKLSVGSLFRRIGVHVESIALDDSAKSDSIARPWSESDVESLQTFVDEVYERFLKLVTEARGIDSETLESLAGGRVWSGTQAKEHKLIDELGGLDTCISALSKKIGLEEFDVIHRPIAKSGFDLLELLGADDSNEIEMAVLKMHCLRALASQGFDLRVTRACVRSALSRDSSGPKVWAMCPDEIAIR